MKTVIEALRANSRVSDYKINVHRKESYELFFVKGKLETVRRTDVCEKEVTVYVDHDEFKGDSQFFVYPSTTEEDLRRLIDEAADKALLINNKHYTLPENEEGTFEVESNFTDYEVTDLAALIAKTVFEANTIDGGSLNSVEVFINRHTVTVLNSRGIHKTQVSYDAMVEAIPTYNGEKQSVELYEQYNFCNLDVEVLRTEIARKMDEVKARYEAAAPANPIDCNVILDKQELSGLFRRIAGNLNSSSVYSRSNRFKKGDAIQNDPKGDRIGITMRGAVEGNINSAKFDGDGLALTDRRIVEDGKAVNYYGSSRFGQYLDEEPTGNLGCTCVDAGTADESVFAKGPYLEVVSMSGLQVDFFSDYIGGEVRLAYYHDGEKITPVTALSITGKLSEVMDHIRLSSRLGVFNGYTGPAKALLSHMKIF